MNHEEGVIRQKDLRKRLDFVFESELLRKSQLSRSKTLFRIYSSYSLVSLVSEQPFVPKKKIPSHNLFSLLTTHV